MPLRREKPDLPEPPAKRLRQTKSRIEYALRHGSAALSVVSSRLPSPEVTASPSNNGIALSPIDVAQRVRPEAGPQDNIKSFCDRLLQFRNEESGHQQPRKVPISIAQAKFNPSPKVTATAIKNPLHRLQASFQQSARLSTRAAKFGGPLPSQPPTHPAGSPSADDEYDPALLKQQLAEHFITTASTLHHLATKSLDHAHDTLSRALKASLEGDKTVFRSKIKPLSRPVDTLKVQYVVQTADGGETRSETVGGLIRRGEKLRKEFMKRMNGLQREWNKLGIEVGEVISKVEGGGPMDVDGEEETEKERREIQKEIESAEEEIELITEAAMVCSAEIEKEHRRTTLPDLHRYYRSINMF
ncbi:hypothetical protein QBC42DRAFT_318638 [Cladorrhinum samala]|uniref:Uncharacterized protein n=1 Tax=Cladorrhinum samala TaxID=585594 RepID=A0AAV9HCJ3_9PEZI|nr:hypothetical protein QBC42DRAFT_318638 [Cladorrhinum samala]